MEKRKIVAICINIGNMVVLVQNPTGSRQSPQLPGGVVLEKEQPDQAIRRIVLTEVNFDVSNATLVKEIERKHQYVYVYRATVPHGSISRGYGHDGHRILLVEASHLHRLLDNGDKDLIQG